MKPDKKRNIGIILAVILLGIALGVIVFLLHMSYVQNSTPVPTATPEPAPTPTAPPTPTPTPTPTPAGPAAPAAGDGLITIDDFETPLGLGELNTSIFGICSE